MKDCNHPKFQKVKKLSSMTVKCPDCKKDIFFLSDRVHEIMGRLCPPSSQKPISNNNEIGSLYGVPIFISKMENEK